MAGEVEPIIINNEGEAIVPVVRLSPSAEREFENGDLLASPAVGYHALCGANMQQRDVSKTHFVIFCPACNLRVTVPNIVKTYGSLRGHCNVVRGNY